MAKKENNHSGVLVWIAGIASVIIAAVIIAWGSYVTEQASRVDGIANYGVETRKWNHKIQNKVNTMDARIYENNALIRESGREIQLSHKENNNGS